MFALTSGLERTSGERLRGELRRGGGVGERQRRSREATGKYWVCLTYGPSSRLEKTYMNDDGVTVIGHPASDSWNADEVGYFVDDHGHSNHAGRVHGHDPFFHYRGRGHEYSRVSREHCRCRENGRAGHSLFGPSYQVHNACWGHNVCHRDDDHLALARPSHSERNRVSPCNEDDSQVGRSRRGVGANEEGEGIYGESADGDRGQGQSQAWVEVEEWKTFDLFVPCFPSNVCTPNPLSPCLSLSAPLDTLSSRWRSSSR